MNKIPQEEGKKLIKEIYKKMCEYSTDEIRNQLFKVFGDSEIPEQYKSIIEEYRKKYKISDLGFVFATESLCEGGANTPDKVLYQLVFRHAFPYTKNIELDLSKFNGKKTFSGVYSEILRKGYKAWGISDEVIKSIIEKELGNEKSSIHKDILYLRRQKRGIDILGYIGKNTYFIDLVALSQDKNSPINRIIDLSKYPNGLKLIERLGNNDKFNQYIRQSFDKLVKIASYKNIDWINDLTDDEIDNLLLNINISVNDNSIERLYNISELDNDIEL